MNVETERLLLRPFEEGDIERFHCLLSNETVMEFSLFGPFSRELSEDVLEGFIRLQAEKGYSPWAVYLRESAEFVGLCGIQEFEINGNTELEVTFRLSPEYWGCGYGKEAARASYRYALDRLGAEAVYSAIEPGNVRSVSLAKACGLVKESESVLYGKKVDFYVLKKEG